MSHGVAILPQGKYLIASVQGDLSDSEVLELRDDLSDRIGRNRVRGIVVDVTALDVIDSFVARALRALAVTAKLRGAETVIVGIQPEVAIAMVHFKLNLAPLRTALDLDEALAQLGGETQREQLGDEMQRDLGHG
jgi:rsbT antagonist protein RsbS